MSRILGASDQPQRIGDGHLAAHYRVRGTAGTQPTHLPELSLTTKSKLRSIERIQKSIREQIGEIEAQLKSLDERHISDSAPWMSFERASSFEDWVNKNKAAMAQPLSLRAALQNDLQLLRDQMNDLQARARQVERSNLRGLALVASGDFERDVTKLIDHAKKTGTLDEHLIAVIRADADRALSQWQAVVDSDPSSKNIRGLLSQVRKGMLVGIDDDATRAALASVGNGVAKNRRFAEQRFRATPTVENLKKYLGKVRESLLLGGEGMTGVPPARARLRPESSYVVKAGDTLTSISKLFYGAEGFWDSILFANLQVIGKDPERLRPGIVLKIP